jgi:Holliday junction resolvase RusA-like endonuclease
MTRNTKWSPSAKRSLAYQQVVATVAVAAIKPLPLTWEYVRVAITIYLKVNKRGELPGNRGDFDNYCKSVCDGIQYGGVFINDRCITSGVIEVEPCLTEAEERVEVELSEKVMRKVV